ncbi:hypothetical protein CONPUDRAFT_101324 [Coniophora puteana RWD-64-598 SS2]|uniref:Ribosomal protein S5 domain 2-like protein n=1 Tax=Coniophora puteana (strain RWD-64-598) TaxID=741705 RepID=A0A5M3MUU0_CONPW|nr:uncharacterized protein CONPUDRAFT_101324 [Coniophora puteana RWD-64-598 SS2]EIW82883.1 hypothetical protein CONPUDRAFT_101324 [Coniophora puteana RWD-64-598 SS2]
MRGLQLLARPAIRGYASTARPYVPPAQLANVAPASAPQKPRPESPSFFTVRPAYYDQLYELNQALSLSRRALRSQCLLPLPPFARDALRPMPSMWRTRGDLSDVMSTPLSNTRYKSITSVLDQLHECRRIAWTAGSLELAVGISDVLTSFEHRNLDAVTNRKRKERPLDEHGRSYTVGRRKTSSARVWMIPVQHDASASTSAPASETVAPPPTPAQASVNNDIDALFGSSADRTSEPASTALAAAPILSSPAQSAPPVKLAEVLVNNIPIHEYFQNPTDRARIVRPLTLTGSLPAYNIFAIVRGGGLSGQSGAIAHAISKGIVVHDARQEIKDILKKAKLLRRDPRMVERKKTGLEKARKRRAWVRR